ncbi:MAG: NAD(P)H-binding protein [Desulfobacteraceae bacterium]|nr:NAD(P)H-binding protein [Desulfobacteraceae bacterium]
MTETILVTGATGFTGRRTVPMLAARGFKVRCLVRPRSDVRPLESLGVEVVRGDLAVPGSLHRAFAGASGLVSIAPLDTGYTDAIVDAAVAHGIGRAVFVSSTQIFTRLNAEAKAIRLAAEGRIVDSGLWYTILRPTMIYGAAEDRNISRLIRYVKRWPVLFIPGPGKCLVQPIYVGDVARAIADAYQEPGAVGNSYNIAGREPLAFNRLVDIIAGLLGKKIFKVHLPADALIAVFKRVEAAGIHLFLRAEQLERLNEDKAFAYDAAARDFGFDALPFEEGVRREIAALGLG